MREWTKDRRWERKERGRWGRAVENPSWSGEGWGWAAVRIYFH